MSDQERPVLEILLDIAGNVQDIIHSEFQLVATQMREDISTCRSSVLLIGIGVMSAFLAVFFALLGLVFALSHVLPSWAAAVLVALALALCAVLVVKAGSRRLKRLNSVPGGTGKVMESLE